MSKLALSFHDIHPIWSLENRGIIQDDAYFLPLEFVQPFDNEHNFVITTVFCVLHLLSLQEQFLVSMCL